MHELPGLCGACDFRCEYSHTKVAALYFPMFDDFGLNLSHVSKGVAESLGQLLSLRL
jgi:hypothetical protein